MEIIELDLSDMFKEDQERKDRATYLKRMSKVNSVEMNRAAELLADIITDAPRYGSVVTINGNGGIMDTIVTNPALQILDHIQKLEAQVAELMAQVNA